MKTVSTLFAVLFGVLVMTGFASCKKEVITPGNYILGQPSVDTTNWQSLYGDSGTVPTWSNNSSTPNELVGTKWVLTYLQIGFSTPPLSVDTIYFVNNTEYTINTGAVRTYQLSVGVTLSSKSLTLNYHYPFGSGNYTGEVASTFVSDGVILNTEFLNTNSSTTTVRASFLKL